MALDIMDGRMFAVPAIKKPVIDGDLKDWDTSAREWIAISRDTAERYSGEVMLMYDDDALYIGGIIRTAGGPMVNMNKPGEKPWIGHEVEFRCIADPTVPFPLDPPNNLNDPSLKPWAPRFNTLTMWEETISHTPHIQLTNAPPYVGGKRNLTDPAGVQIKFKTWEKPNRYSFEARVPWKFLGVESGKNPFKPGEEMTAFWTVMWPEGISHRAECLRINPTGGFGWATQHVKDWGRVVFSPTGNLKRGTPSLEKYLELTNLTPKSSSFTVDVPENGGLLSVNIVDKDGNIIREIAGGEEHKKGAAKFYWDGFDWYGNPMPPGNYTWKAYWHKPLKAVFAGAPSTNAKVPYETRDGKGNWGGNMAPPMSVAADESGRYLLWGSNEGGNSIVKTDYEGNVCWRNTPYVINGGYGPHFAIAVNSKYCFVVSGWMECFLSRYNVKNGLTEHFPSSRFITLNKGMKGPSHIDWNSPMPSLTQIAVNEKYLFIPDHYNDRLLVLNPDTGEVIKEIKIAKPRAAALDNGKDLYVLTNSNVSKVTVSSGRVQPVVSYSRRKFRNPWGLAVNKGTIFISDNGGTNQICRFRYGRQTGTFGSYGGRPWGGAYNRNDLLNPAGMCFDKTGTLWVAESSLPNVFKAIDPEKLTVKDQLFGDIGYTPPSWPDCDDPLSVYTSEYYTSGIVHGILKGDGSSGPSDAYWDFRKIDWPYLLYSWACNWRVPYCFRGNNGVKYMFASTMFSPSTLVRLDGTKFSPLNYISNWNSDDGKTFGLEVWADRNSSGRIEPEEKIIVSELAGRKIAPNWRHGGSTVLPDGTLYLVGSNNAAYRIPVKKILSNGAVEWDWKKSEKVASGIVPYLNPNQNLIYTARETIIGIDVDTKGNMYFSFTANLPYANKIWADKLRFGLCHTGRYNAVKVTAFDKNGKRLFIAGRKATGVLRPGEMYHHWSQGGIVADKYFSVSSEWTPFTVFTHDGFFVQSLLADPNKGETPSPYSLGGGETFSGRLVWFPKLKQAYYYTGNTHAMVYRIDGFQSDGSIAGEKRFSGTMKLTKHVDPYAEEVRNSIKPEMVKLTDPLKTGAWGNRSFDLSDNNGAYLAKINMGYDDKFIYARYTVKSKNPFVNRSDDPAMAFKGGDSVGFYLGSAKAHSKPQPDDIRILATVLRGKPVVIGWFYQSEVKKPWEYYTPAGGRWKFENVDIIPGYSAQLTQYKDGYVMEFAIPQNALPGFVFKPGKKYGFEAEILLSGNGVRGLQAISRNHLFTSRSAGSAKMVDDIPCEAHGYPEFWGTLEIK